MFRQIKEMKAMLEGAPGVVEQEQQLARAQQLVLAHHAARQARQAGQVQRDAPTLAGRLACARERMASLNEMIAAQTHAANRAAANLAGPSVIRRTVTIAGMRQIAMINFDLLFEFELTVLPDEMPPYPATTQQLVSQAEVRRLVPGLTLEATVDVSNPAAIWLDLSSLR